MSDPGPTEADAATLRGQISGNAIEPGGEGWDAARQAFNLTVDQRPALIAIPTDAEDVAKIVRFAAAEGLRVAPQRTGHNAAPLDSLERTILLKTTRLDSVEIDADAASARVGSGARWEDVVPRASELGLAALHGSTPDVSIAGYTLGGGMGWYARKHGLAANSVIAIELVTAAGSPIRTDADNEPELFWALRGGGGNFGVVTAIEFELFAAPKVYAGALFFPYERAEEVLHAWHAWTVTAPDSVTSVGRVIQFPPLDEVPEPVRGRSFTVVEAVNLGDEGAGAEAIEPLRELGPAMDTFAMVSPVGIADLHMDPREPVPYFSAHSLLGDLPTQAIDGLLEACGPDSGSTLLSVELRHMGGALSRPLPGNGALSMLQGNFAMFAVGIAADEASAAHTKTDLAAVSSATAPYETGHYFNFVEEPTEIASIFDPATADRLQRAKATYDPGGLFQANHELAPRSISDD